MAEKKLKLTFEKTGGPFGDSTSNYNVELSKTTTVGEFIDYIIRDYSVSKNEWGSFKIGTGYDTFGKTFLDYNRGKVYIPQNWRENMTATEFYFDIRDEEIDRITANGGWSCMDYTIFLKYKV